MCPSEMGNGGSAPHPALFARYLEDNLNVTVPHEVAHNMIDCLYGIRKVRPRGEEWKAVMQEFGAGACRCDFSGIPEIREALRLLLRLQNTQIGSPAPITKC